MNLARELWMLNTQTKQTHKIDISIDSDAPETRPYLAGVSDKIQGFDISPTGKRALIVARGKCFQSLKTEGISYNLSNNCGARDKDAAWSPDGKTVAYLSDKSGEYEIYLQSSWKAMKKAMKPHKDGYRHTLRWSLDSKKIAFADQTLRFYILDVSSKIVTEADHAEFENVDISLNNKPIYDFSWSPDSKFLAYSKMNKDQVYQIYIYSLDSKTVHTASNGLFYDFNPVFTPDGEHLLFVSNRSFDPTFCDMEWEMVYKNIAVIVSLNLKKDGTSILPFKNDSESPDLEKSKTTSAFKIDFDGLADSSKFYRFNRQITAIWQ